ncbi:hypothetical protein [Thalassobaculum sp.]|uniref:phage tail terminator protein n=1 Tax=Thalassobaculum sp. TaxID=2022740 RepID=UPI0032EF17FF
MADVLDGGVPLVDAAIARLDVEIPALRTIGRAADLARLTAAKALPSPGSTPAAFVIEPADTAGANAMAAGLLVRQLITVRLVIVLALYHANDPTGAAALEQLDTLKPLLMAALIGWEPGGDYTPIEHERRGLVSSLGSPLVVFQHALRTGWHLRKH